MKRLLSAVLTAAFVAVACTTGAPAPGPTSSGTSAPAAKPAINEQTRGAIQALLQRQHDTMAARDQTAFVATMDPERLALKRCATETYDISARLGVGPVLQVNKIEAYGDTYVRAYVQESAYGLRRIYFRQAADGKWVQSEPKDAELGGEKKTTVGDIQIDYWGIDEDVVQALGRGSLEAQKVVLANLLSTERRDPFAVRFYPTRGVAGIQSCSTLGYAVPNTPSDPYIRILSYWFTTTNDMSPFGISILSHEWLHWAQDQFSQGIDSRMPWWMVEGWPDYVGQSRPEAAKRSALCQSQTPTLKQLEDGADPYAPPEVTSQYYAFANTMVEYLYAAYGGADAYRKLALVLKSDANPKTAFPKALAVTSDQFYEGWKAAAKKKYC